MLAQVRAGNQSYAGIIADPGLFQLHELRNFQIRGAQLFQLLDVARPHPRLVEGTIIRERMLIAAADTEEEKRAEKNDLVPHSSIVAGAKGKAAESVLSEIPGRK